MIDLKIIAIKDLLPITSATFAAVTPFSLIIEGTNFREATQVMINDIECPEFMVLSDSKLIAQVPSSETNSILRKVAVLATKPSTNRNSMLHFEIGGTIQSLSGLERLVQTFCKLLLQTPGSDKFSKNLGGGLRRIVGKSVTKGGVETVQASVVEAINRTKDQLTAIQHKNQAIPSDERLLNVSIEGIGFNDQATMLSLELRLVAMSGRQAVANLTA